MSIVIFTGRRSKGFMIMFGSFRHNRNKVIVSNGVDRYISSNTGLKIYSIYNVTDMMMVTTNKRRDFSIRLLTDTTS